MLVTCCSDEWELRYKLRITLVGMAMKKVPWMPWESLQFPTGIPGENEYGQVPDHLFETPSSARCQALEYMEGDTFTVEGAIETLTTPTKHNALLKLDRSFEVTINWLVEHAQDMIETTVRDRILMCLPTKETQASENPITFFQVVPLGIV